MRNRRRTSGALSPSVRSPTSHVLASLRTPPCRGSSRQRSPSRRSQPQVRPQEARHAPRARAFRVLRRSHRPYRSRPKPSGRKLRMHRREPSRSPESRRGRTKTASFGRTLLPDTCSWPLGLVRARRERKHLDVRVCSLDVPDSCQITPTSDDDHRLRLLVDLACL
jgi:hypothetical protein